MNMFDFMLMDNFRQDVIMYKFSKSLVKIEKNGVVFELRALHNFFIEEATRSDNHLYIGRKVFSNGFELDKYQNNNQEFLELLSSH